MEQTFVCILNKAHDCAYRRYGYECELKVRDGYAVASCKYRVETAVLPVAKLDESPENFAQQPHAVKGEAPTLPGATSA